MAKTKEYKWNMWPSSNEGDKIYFRHYPGPDRPLTGSRERILPILEWKESLENSGILRNLNEKEPCGKAHNLSF